jgi:hypothetical protein
MKINIQASTRYFAYSNGGGFTKYVPDLDDAFLGVQWVQGRREKFWVRAGIQSESWFEGEVARDRIWEFSPLQLLGA